MSQKVTRALVTGGGGFIGSCLVRLLLREGYSVRVLDIQKGRLAKEADGNLDFVGLGEDHSKGGMMSPRIVERAIDGVDVVYHLALNWNGHTWGGHLPLADLMNLNIRGTLNLLEAARIHRVKQFLYASSIAVYGKRDSPVMDEAADCRAELWRGGPGPGYAITKHAIERLCLTYHLEYGVPVTVLRIDVVFDDEEYQDLSPETIRPAIRGEPLKVVKQEAGASIHVNDVAMAFLKATLNERAYGEVFNVTNPKAFITDEEVYRLVIDSSGSRSGIEFVQAALTGPVIGSVEKAARVLGWKPAKGRNDLEKVIVRMVNREARQGGGKEQAN